MAKPVTTIIVSLVALACLVTSIFQFKEKGFLFNNAFIYASKEERSRMDKKPHYRQSGIVFFLLAINFFCIAAEIITGKTWLYIVQTIMIAAVIIYAIFSSIKTSK